MITKKYLVTGKVQGVWFRQSTKEAALNIGMTGSAINLASGQVEVKASGSEQQHEELKAFLKVGPELANVTDLEEENLETISFNGFVTG